MRMMQRTVGLISVPCYLFLVVLAFIPLAIILDYRGTREEAFLNVLIDPSTGKINEYKVRLLWINCRQDLNDLLQANVQHPELEQALFNCIRKNNIIFQIFREHRVFYTRYFKSLFRRHEVPRRILAPKDTTEVPDSDLGLSPSSSPSPSPDSEPADAPDSDAPDSEAPDSEAPDSEALDSDAPDSEAPDSEAPDSEAPDISTTPTPSQSPAFSPPLPKSSNQPSAPVRSPKSNSNSGNEDSDDKGAFNQKTILIYCIVTALVTAFVALLLLLLCFRKQITRRPISGGEKLDLQPLGNEPIIHQKASSDGSIDLQMSSDGNSSLGAVAGTAAATAASTSASTSAATAAGTAAAAGASKASAESSNTSGNTNSVLPLPPGWKGTSAPKVPPVNALSERSSPLPPEPSNPVSANPPPAPPGSASVPRPPGPLPPPKPPGAQSGPRPPDPPGAPPGAQSGPRPPYPPGALPGAQSGPRPPDPPGAPPKPPPPMPLGPKAPKPPPSGLQNTPNAASGEGSGAAGDVATASKAKLKPFFWDKVAAKPDHAMVWNQIKSGSFQFNEEMIETLFGCSAIANNKNNGKKDPSAQDNAPQYVQILETKKAQNLAILLRAMNVTTEEVCDALREGSELPVEVLQTLLKMAPTADEAHKLKMFNGEISQLGTAELFLKHLLDVPFAFKRMDVLLLMCTLDEDVSATKESFETLEVACKDLRRSRIFLKLLEAVLKTGNRMNAGTFHGGAQAIKLDTLLKLSDVKGADGKTTLLHFVVQEIIRTEGLKAARAERESRSSASKNSDDLLEDVSHDLEEHYLNLGFQAVSRLTSELENVKKAAGLDAENLTGTVARLGHSLLKARDFLNSEMKDSEEDSGFHNTLKSFVEKAEFDVKSLLVEEKRIMELVKDTGSYFHGNNKKDEGVRLFVVVRDFLIILDKVCKEVKDKPVISHIKESHASSSS